MSWRPVLSGALADRARAAVRSIAHDLPNHAPVMSVPADRINLASGAAGTALFHGYVGDWDRASELLNQAIEAVADLALHSSLYSGWSGVAWAAAHLRGDRDAAPHDLPDDDDPNVDTDARVLEHLRNPRATAAWDLITGTTGLAIYALERHGRPLTAPILATYLARLEQRVVETPTGLTLLSPPVDWTPAGSYNAGAAHGIPGVLGVLGSIEGPAAQRLRQGFTAWLRSILREAVDGSVLPYWIDLRTPDQRDAGCRAAWCYGDPGAAVALLRGARAAHDPELEALALVVGHAAAARAIETTQVDDAGLCHGAAGLLHLFNRLYQATHDERFRAAAVIWAERTLAYRRDDGVGGFAALRTTGACADPGLINGASKLALRKMTVRTLSAIELDLVAGGGQTDAAGEITCTKKNANHQCATL